MHLKVTFHFEYMIDPAYYIPELYDLKTHGRPSSYLVEAATEYLISFLSSQNKKKIYFDINHADGDAIGSIVNLAILLEILKVPYTIESYNSSYKLTFSASRLPLNEMKANLERDLEILYIVTDTTPWYPFYSDLEKFFSYPKANDKVGVMILDHHPFIGGEEAKKIREIEREYEDFIYLNFGLSSDANVWWRGPNIPCAGEITFEISREVLKKLGKYELSTIKQFLIPTLLATYTDFRTENFLNKIEDKELKKTAENYTNIGTIKEYLGFTTYFDEFINMFNGGMRATGLKVGEELRTHSLTETQIGYSPTHRLLKSAAAHVMLTAKVGNPMVLTRNPRDLGYSYENGYHLGEIIRADAEWEKIKSVARKAFLHYHLNRYIPRSDRVSYFNDTKSIMALLPKTQTVVSYRGTTIDLSKLLKYPPYIEFFFTAYRPIAEMEIIRNSSLIIVGVESSKSDGYSEFSLRSNTPSVPVGRFASEIANRIRMEKKYPYHYAFGGGHETAAGLRIRQDVLDEFKKDYNHDVYSLINELIKGVRL